MSSNNSSNLNFAVKIFSLLGLIFVGYLNQQGKLQASTSQVPSSLDAATVLPSALVAQPATDSLVFVRTSLNTAQRSDKAPALAP